MKKFLVIGLMAALVSCGAIKNPLQPSLAYNLENAYGIAQASAIAYTKLPRCTAVQTTLCSKATIVVKLASYDKVATTALAQLEAFVRNPANYPGVTYTSLFSAAQNAIAAFSAIEQENGVK